MEEQKSGTVPVFNRKYADSVFRMLFREKENTADIYETLSGVKVEPADIGDITLSDELLRNFHNDAAFLAGDKCVVLLEQQTKFNPNMPLRILLYLGRIYEIYLNSLENLRAVHGGKLVKVPRPEFAVIYTGELDKPFNKKILRLSDAFNSVYSETLGFIEMEVPVYSMSAALSGKTDEPGVDSILGEYVRFLDIAEAVKKSGVPKEKWAVSILEASEKQGVLVKFLRKYGVEVLNVLTQEFDVEVYGNEQRTEGEVKGRSQMQIEVVRSMLEEGFSVDIITKITKMSEESILSLSEN